MKLSIVIPAHNEEDCIEKVVLELLYAMKQASIDCEIIVVNDHITDSTPTTLKKLFKKYPEIRMINNPSARGFGFTVRAGLSNYCGDAVAIVMADGSDSPQDVVTFFYELQKGYDCVFGSRFIIGGKTKDYPKVKLIVNRIANLFIRIIFGLKYNDITNAFKMYRRETIDGIKPFLSHHFNLTVELPLKAIVRGYSYKVLPNTWTNRKAGESKLKIKEKVSR